MPALPWTDSSSWLDSSWKRLSDPAANGGGLLEPRLWPRVGFAGIWDEAVTHRQRFGVPLGAGAAMSVLFVVTDMILAPVHGLGRIPHPPFPLSVGASLTAGIGEEIIFRLLFITFWVWLISRVLLRGRRPELVFAGVTAASAVLFTVAHLPMVMTLMGIGTVREIPWVFAIEMLLLNGTLSVGTAFLMCRWGIIPAMGLHFRTDVGWHVVWGGLTELPLPLARGVYSPLGPIGVPLMSASVHTAFELPDLWRRRITLLLPAAAAFAAFHPTGLIAC